mmetsp:Transcript_21604/g.48864  ORF Transcript_21604/g.48864 Transcript_21604/m.48864 type:complete len:229 (+) Transcript_21604:753-1439(+)
MPRPRLRRCPSSSRPHCQRWRRPSHPPPPSLPPLLPRPPPRARGRARASSSRCSLRPPTLAGPASVPSPPGRRLYLRTHRTGSRPSLYGGGRCGSRRRRRSNRTASRSSPSQRVSGPAAGSSPIPSVPPPCLARGPARVLGRPRTSRGPASPSRRTPPGARRGVASSASSVPRSSSCPSFPGAAYRCICSSCYGPCGRHRIRRKPSGQSSRSRDRSRVFSTQTIVRQS